jgi:hypothetical protein
LIARRQGEDKRLLAAVGNADAKAADAIRAAIADVDAKLDAIDNRLVTEFPEYASLRAIFLIARTSSQAGLLITYDHLPE